MQSRLVGHNCALAEEHIKKITSVDIYIASLLTHATSHQWSLSSKSTTGSA